MLRSLLFFILICNFTVVVAQSEPQFSQNSFNLLSVNPGFAGSTGKVNLTALYREQWSGIEGAPKTMVFSADMGMKFLGYEHGLGFSFLNDEIGEFKTIKGSLIYSFRVDVGEGSIGSGASVGVFQQSLDGSKLFTDPSNKELLGNSSQSLGLNGYHSANDQTVPTTNLSSKLVMDLGLGVYYKDKRMYSGISVQHIHQPKPELNVILDTHLQRTWFFTGGYSFELIDKPIEIEPQFFLKTDELIYQLDVTTVCRYKKRYWGGLGYRLDDAIIVLAGLEMKDGLKVGCSYDFTTSSLVGTNSFDLMLSYSFVVGVSKKSKHYRSVRYL